VHDFPDNQSGSRQGKVMGNIEKMNEWVTRLTQSELPVLKHTARDLAALRADENKLNARTISEVISRDPIMTVKLLRYLQLHKHKAQTAEVIQVEQVLLMLGLDTFFNKIDTHPLVEEMLKPNAVALPPTLRVIHRSHRASEYAKDWAVQLHDLHYEEVRIAALLHDIAEILMWCFAPQAMLEIRDIQHSDKTQRSQAVQEQVLGFSLIELQKELAIKWKLPELLLTLMNDSNAKLPRVRNVVLAVNLARHSANGWNDAALPDDYRDIGELLRIPAEQVKAEVAADEGAAGS
jgi:HD-like signal output (HDOD) protein